MEELLRIVSANLDMLAQRPQIMLEESCLSMLLLNVLLELSRTHMEEVYVKNALLGTTVEQLVSPFLQDLVQQVTIAPGELQPQTSLEQELFYVQ